MSDAFEGQVLAVEIARMVERLSREIDGDAVDASLLGLLAGLVVRERGHGHSEIDLGEWSDAELGEGVVLPSREEILACVQHSSLVGDGSPDRPLALDGEALALTRDRRAEDRLAERLRHFDRPASEQALSAATIETFHRLFDEPSDAAIAAATALLRHFLLLTGGPGTGKTTTVVKLLAVLLTERQDLRIALCAPTGKAAARLQESIDAQRADPPVDDAVRAALELRVRTLHDLLGVRPDDSGARHHAENPLPYDVVVVDEASMVDLSMMDLLAEALPTNARWILVGDRDQLASVDAGAVLADLVGVRGGTHLVRSASFVESARPLLGTQWCDTVDAPADAVPLLDAVVELRKNWRFEEQQALSELAAALRAGDADGVLAKLPDEEAAAVRLAPPTALDAILDRVTEQVVAAMPDEGVTDPASWLDAFDRMPRLLSARRSGPDGASGLNRRLEARLGRRGWRVDDLFYAGQPVLVQRNHRELGLANGDIGICLPDPERPGRFEVWFRRSRSDAPRAVGADQLPEHATAWAMTVHKSQGSEFLDVVVVLPEEGHPLLSRELLYTAATRARRSLVVAASEASVRRATLAPGNRRTGLKRTIFKTMCH